MRLDKRAGWSLAAVAVLTTAACNSFLDVKPVNELPRNQAIAGATGARAAVTGIYDALQSLSYYGGDFVLLTDVSSDDVNWIGTFTTYQDADANRLRADNGDVGSIWNAIYAAISRANFAIEEIPKVSALSADSSSQFSGEAYFLRALGYHDLVRTYGGPNINDPAVPLVLTSASTVTSTAGLRRATVGEVYTQIISDLTQAEAKLKRNATPATRATRGAARALRARVELYRGNYAAAESLATVVINMPQYQLATNYSDLFTAEGTATTEDIFRVDFNAVDAQNMGWYFNGRSEVEPSVDLIAAYDNPGFNPNSPYATFDPADARAIYNFEFDRFNTPYLDKWPTTKGTEDLHVLRLAEMYLIRAEARARMNVRLSQAVDDINTIRARAGATPYVFGVDLTNAASVLAAVYKEERLEFAAEGHRWFDMKRSGEVFPFLTSQGRPATQALYPIPQAEITVSPGLTQNPGY